LRVASGRSGACHPYWLNTIENVDRQGKPLHHTPLIAIIVAGLGLAFVFGAIANRLKPPAPVGYRVVAAMVGPPGNTASVTATTIENTAAFWPGEGRGVFVGVSGKF